MWICGGSAPVAKSAFGNRKSPIKQNPMPFGSPLHHRQKIADLLWKIIFRHVFRVTQGWFARLALMVILCGWHILFCSPSRTRGTKCILGSMENPYFLLVGAVWHIWSYSLIAWTFEHGHRAVCSSVVFDVETVVEVDPEKPFCGWITCEQSKHRERWRGNSV